MNRILIHITGWVIYFTTLAFYKFNNLGLESALKHMAFAGSLNIAIYYIQSALVYSYFEQKKYWQFLIFTIGLFTLFFNIRMLVEIPLFNDFFELIPNRTALKTKRFISISVLFAMFMSIVFTLLESRVAKERKAQQIINRQNEAQLLFLKSQINPHFLFNALHNIYSLSLIKSEQTPKMVLGLSNLLRYSIYESQKAEVLLINEIEQIRKYLDLIQLTKEAPLQIAITIKGELDTLKIEPMILIPVIENCIKHGDIDTNKNAYIKINCTIDQIDFIFKVENSKDNFNQQKDQVGGVGLKNISKRLTLKYKNEHSFLTNEKEDTFEVILKIPKSKMV